MPVSNYQNNVLLDLTFADPVFLALHIDDPGPLGAEDEVVGGSYERQAISFADPAADGVKLNTSLAIFLGMPELLVGVSHMSLWTDLPPDGDCLWYGLVSGGPVPFDAGDVAVVLPETVSVTLDPPPA